MPLHGTQRSIGYCMVPLCLAWLRVYGDTS